MEKGDLWPIAKVVGDLTASELKGWKNALWEGEYYIPPECVEHSAWFRGKALAHGLVHRFEEDVCVTPRGEELIAYLNRSVWRRTFTAIRAIAKAGQL